MNMGDEARRLRAEEQLSISQIKDRLGASREQIEDWVRGVPAPEWTKRPNAKDDLRAEAIALRHAGYSIPGIARRLGVARSTAHRWTGHIPLVDDTAEAQRRKAHNRMVTEARWARHRSERDDRRRQLAAETAARVGELGDRDLLLVGAVLCWCGGSKTRPSGRSVQVEFASGDPRLVRLFLRFVEGSGVCRGDLALHAQIPATADAATAVGWWAEQLGMRPEEFGETTVRRHPRAGRPGHAADWHGCLRIAVCRSSELYRTIECVMDALCGPAGAPEGGAG